MSEAAHPQHDETSPAGERWPLVPREITVPGVGESGGRAAVTLQMVVDGDGVVSAPGIDTLLLSPTSRQYVLDFCAMWTRSISARPVHAKPISYAGQMLPPRRVHVRMGEEALRNMLGLRPDETLRAVSVDPDPLAVRFVVESPRLPRLPACDVESPCVTLPIEAAYEGSAAGPTDLDAARRELQLEQALAQENEDRVVNAELVAAARAWVAAGKRQERDEVSSS